MEYFMSNGSWRQDKYTWASSSSGSRCIALHNILHMERFSVQPLTLRSIGGHDVLLDTAHELLESKG